MDQLATFLKQHPQKVLLAEDDEFNQVYFSKIIGNIGFEIDVANNGNEALDLLLVTKYDFVFLDYHMPLMTGAEIVQEIKNQTNSINNNTPFIAVSGTAMQQEKDHAMRSGFDLLLGKPFAPKDLYQILHDYTKISSSKNNPNSPIKVINLSKIKSIYEDDELIKDLLKAIKTELPKYLSHLESPDFFDNTEKMKQLIHKIKPSFSYLGIDIAADELNYLEDQLSKGIRPPEIENKCKELVNLAKQAMVELQTELS